MYNYWFKQSILEFTIKIKYRSTSSIFKSYFFKCELTQPLLLTTKILIKYQRNKSIESLASRFGWSLWLVYTNHFTYLTVELLWFISHIFRGLRCRASIFWSTLTHPNAVWRTYSVAFFNNCNEPYICIYTLYIIRLECILYQNRNRSWLTRQCRKVCGQIRYCNK